MLGVINDAAVINKRQMEAIEALTSAVSILPLGLGTESVEICPEGCAGLTENTKSIWRIGGWPTSTGHPMQSGPAIPS